MSGLLLAALEATFFVTAATERGCTICHEPRAAAERHADTAHADVECLDCHGDPGMVGFATLNLRAARNLYVSAAPWVESDRSRAIVADRVCVECHAQIAEGLVVSGSIRMSHAEPAAEGRSCTSCHVDSLHMAARLTNENDHSACADCHDGDRAGIGCSVCHVSEPPRDKSLLTGVEALTHGEDWRNTHFMGNMDTCTICHARTFCRQCHQVDLPHARVAFPYLHGQEALEAGSEACIECHLSAFCVACHVVEMPHAPSYLERHRADAEQRGPGVCDRCHVPDDCQLCHLRHVHPGIPAELRERLGGGAQ